MNRLGCGSFWIIVRNHVEVKDFLAVLLNNTFIHDSDGDIRTKTKYRSDTHRKVLIDAYRAFNDTIKPKIFNLLVE